MTQQTFSLVPFPASNIPGITITGKIARQNNIIALHYSLTGNLDNIFFPSPSEPPGRKNELWKTTCLEFFLAIQDQPGYWEFNMSPSGDWNVYHMDAYRRVGFTEETSLQCLRFVPNRNEADIFTLEATVDLSPIIEQSQLVEVSVTAIIQTKDGAQSYWALTHPASQADFHLRESFILVLAEQTRLAQRSVLGD
ncbi:MAG TPA: DOMON-like domain-containing protein [Anaerolineales bacterium]|nr:DOMON-like domain-containing protein [Anaerolineales bacterium]